MTGSFIVSALILGGLFTLLAFVIYLLAIRDAVDHIRSQAETVYEVARAAQTGYEWSPKRLPSSSGCAKNSAANGKTPVQRNAPAFFKSGTARYNDTSTST